MNHISQHKMLLAGDSFAHCSDQVHKFFDLTSLVIYDCIETIEAQSFSGLDADFFHQLQRAESQNKKLVQELIDELIKAKIINTADLVHLEQGYVSKTLHILTHFLDGFIGIDSFFYNLLDDSHWLSSSTAENIRENPGHYWLLHVDCFATTKEEAGLLRF